MNEGRNQNQITLSIDVDEFLELGRKLGEGRIPVSGEWLWDTEC